MTMTSTDAWVGAALRRVTNAATIAELHGARSRELESLTRESVEQAINHALGYGFTAEAIAAAASMTVDQVQQIADGSAVA